jgi:hypothetical protein
MGYNVHDVLKKFLFYITLNSTIKINIFGMISNYDHFSRWNIESTKNMYIFTNSNLLKIYF